MKGLKGILLVSMVLCFVFMTSSISFATELSGSYQVAWGGDWRPNHHNTISLEVGQSISVNDIRGLDPRWQTYSIEDTSIAQFNENTIIGVQQGNTILLVSIDGGFQFSMDVEVTGSSTPQQTQAAVTIAPVATLAPTVTPFPEVTDQGVVSLEPTATDMAGAAGGNINGTGTDSGTGSGTESATTGTTNLENKVKKGSDSVKSDIMTVIILVVIILIIAAGYYFGREPIGNFISNYRMEQAHKKLASSKVANDFYTEAPKKKMPNLAALKKKKGQPSMDDGMDMGGYEQNYMNNENQYHDDSQYFD